MAFGVFNNAYLSVNGSDLSSYLKSVSLKYDAAMLDASVMGNTSKSNMAGQIDWSFTATFLDDVAGVDAVLFPLVGAVPFPIIFKPNADSANPTYSGNVVLSGNPMGGNHGALLEKSVTFHCNGDLTRA